MSPWRVMTRRSQKRQHSEGSGVACNQQRAKTRMGQHPGAALAAGLAVVGSVGSLKRSLVWKEERNSGGGSRRRAGPGAVRRPGAWPGAVGN